MRFIHNLPLGQKFAGLGLLALLLIAPLAAALLHSQWVERSAAQAEMSALPRVHALLDLVREAQVHRGLTASALSGNAAAAAKRTDQAGKVQAALEAAVKSLDGQLPSAGQERLRDVQRQWQTLRDDLQAQRLQGPASFARHNAMVAMQIALVTDVADATGLVMDPEAATYHLVMLVTERMPWMTELLGQARAQGAAALAKGEVSAAQRVLLQGHLAQLAQLAQAADRHFTQLSLDEEHAQALQPSYQKARDAHQQAIAAIRQQVLEPAQPQGDSSAFFASMTGHIDAQFAMAEAAFARLTQDLDARVAAIHLHMALELGSLALGLAIGLTVMVAVARSASRSVAVAQDALAALARGELDHRVGEVARDEAGQIADQLGRSMQELAQLVGDIKRAGDHVGTASAQIAGGNADLAARTEQAASSIQRAASSLEQITASVGHNAENARQAAALANQASDMARSGDELIGRLVATMGQISDSSARIADITGVIDGIAFQTNILALNAAVEAARAGDAGRGFAVVASEVRALAQRSASAAREIKTLIGQSVECVDGGAQLVSDTRQAMGQILSQAGQVSTVVQEIGLATTEQADGIAHVNGAVNALEHATQQNAALVEESAAAAESLKHQAEGLMQTVSRFRTGAPA